MPRTIMHVYTSVCTGLLTTRISNDAVHVRMGVEEGKRYFCQSYALQLEYQTIGADKVSMMR